MKHLVFFSGGAGSYAATKRVIEKNGVENLHLLFTDTTIEHKELYRFMVDALEKIFSVDLIEERELVSKLTDTEINQELRKDELLIIQDAVNKKVPQMHWIRYEHNGLAVDPWDIFTNYMFIGNSRAAQCSNIIKQRLARDYVIKNFKRDALTVYLGIDWGEQHRTKAPTANWLKYASAVEFPMCDAPYFMKDDIVKIIGLDGIRIPTPYLEGSSHLNCGGFCVRGGQGHFVNLHKTNPALFDYHAERESSLKKQIQEKNNNREEYSILKQRRGGVTYSLSLKELRDQLLHKKDTIDLFEIGGCGCFVNDSEIDQEYTHEKWGIRDLKIRKFK